MAIRLEPHDEYMHPLEEAKTFNESMYFNVYDPANNFGGWFRCGNRANEGHAEMTVCLYLPDGRVGFTYARPPIDNNDAFDAGGIKFSVVEPFKALTVEYEGKVVLLDEPLQMADPKKAFTENPWVECSVHLDYKGESDMFGGEPEESHEKEGEEFARGHYEQLVSATGSVRVGDQEWDVSGFGLRDHSWGPRTWQAPYYYRWLTANFGADFGFMASRIARRDSDGTRAGFLWNGKTNAFIHDVRIETDWDEPDKYHRNLTVKLKSGDQELTVKGEVMNLIPLRNRRDANVTRISEGMTKWTLEDGTVGYGLSEYLDQIIDDAPVGIAE
ncbi:MAG: hypothetical protein QOJ00_1538 [Actinomycetota bacterium]